MFGYKEHKIDIENHYLFKYLKLRFKQVITQVKKILNFIIF